MFFHIFPPFVKVGMGFCLQIAFGREPAFRRLAKCDAGSSRTGGFFPPRRGFSALVWRIAPAFFHIVRTLAQRWLFPLRRTHTRCRGKKPHTVETRGSRRRTVPAVEGCKDANCSRCYPLALLLRQAPEPLVGAALRKNAEISLCDFQRPLRNAELLCKRKDFLGWSWLRQKPARLVFHLHGLCLHLPCAV